MHPVGPSHRVSGHVLEHGDECCLQSWPGLCLLIFELIYKCLIATLFSGEDLSPERSQREPLCSSSHETSASGQGKVGPGCGDHLDKDVFFCLFLCILAVSQLLVQSVLVEPLAHLAMCSAVPALPRTRPILPLASVCLCICYILHMFLFEHAVYSLFLELLNCVDAVIFLHLYLLRDFLSGNHLWVLYGSGLTMPPFTYKFRFLCGIQVFGQSPCVCALS